LFVFFIKALGYAMKYIPNIITLSRVAVLALLVWLAFETWSGAATIAFFCILWGAISDFLDGYLARKYDLTTNFGKIMDALIDKVMVLGSFILLLVVGLLPLWALPLVVLVAARELGITWMRLVAARRGVVLAAEKAGKRKAIWQITSVCVLFAVPMFGRDIAAWTGWPMSDFADFVFLNGIIYFLYAAWLALSSGAIYLKTYWRIVFPRVRNAEDGR